MKNKLQLAIFLAALFGMAASPKVLAQSVKTNAMEKARWYNAPREIQIIDERPVVKDFREAPENPGSIDLPPGPQGSAGGYGGPGAGAAGDGGSTLPPGGLQLGGPNQGYRSAPQGMVPLPKSGFGRQSNIPARGMGPKGPLPGVNMGVLGKLMSQQKGQAAGSPQGMAANRGRSKGYTAPAAQTYSGGYGQGLGSGYGGSSSRTETMVRGSLLRSK